MLLKWGTWACLGTLCILWAWDLPSPTGLWTSEALGGAPVKARVGCEQLACTQTFHHSRKPVPQSLGCKAIHYSGPGPASSRTPPPLTMGQDGDRCLWSEKWLFKPDLPTLVVPGLSQYNVCVFFGCSFHSCKMWIRISALLTLQNCCHNHKEVMEVKVQDKWNVLPRPGRGRECYSGRFSFLWNQEPWVQIIPCCRHTTCLRSIPSFCK